MTADYWIDRLALKRHEEGGWYREVWVSDWVIPGEVLPPAYGGDRRCCSLIYYLLKGKEISAWHRLSSPEIWVWHAGGLLEQTLGGTGPQPRGEQGRIIGPGRGDFQAVIPSRTWQTTRILEGDFGLVSCIVSPAFSPEDFFLPPPAGI
ncbi:MAG: cupin domain-containing protein [Spirochaetaceae bacterium]|jgi:predicted cupin superfamily sugar epimerase|nr:cupin domain-containing protein [Spirochaetaceae bacterium]